MIINVELVKKYLDLAIERCRIPSEVKTWPIKEVLSNLKVVQGYHPTNAGLLMFSDNPSKYIDNSHVRVVIQITDGRVLDDKRFAAPLWQLVNVVIDRIRGRGIAIGWEIPPSSVERVELLSYTLEAVREAIVNAVVHRNYLAHGTTLIKILPHMISVENPRGFPPGVTPIKPVSRPRNPTLSDLTYRVGLVEELGTGLRRVREACQRAGIIFRVDEWASGYTKVLLSLESRN